jgi:predicted metalloprotease
VTRVESFVLFIYFDIIIFNAFLLLNITIHAKSAITLYILDKCSKKKENKKIINKMLYEIKVYYKYKSLIDLMPQILYHRLKDKCTFKNNGILT